MKRILSITALLAIACCLRAQSSSDLGTWTSLQMVKGWEHTYATARLEHRSYDHISATEAYFGSVGAGYKFAPWLKADINYEFWQIPVSSSPTVHKGVLSVAATLKRETLAVSLREKYELAFTEGGSPYGVLRSRLRAQYTIPDSAFTPYAMYEYFNYTGTGEWQRSLHYAGLEIKLSKHHGLDFFYMYHLYPSGGDLKSSNLLGIGYVLSL